MRSRSRLLPACWVVVLTMAMLVPSAEAAVTLTRAELSSGQLRVEGSGALANHLITVDPGNVTGTTDAQGAFKIQASPYSSSTCRITVSDGTTSASTTLSGCTPSQPTSSPPAVTLTPWR